MNHHSLIGDVRDRVNPSTSFSFETKFSLIIVNTMEMNLILSNGVRTEKYVYFKFPVSYLRRFAENGKECTKVQYGR